MIGCRRPTRVGHTHHHVAYPSLFLHPTSPHSLHVEPLPHLLSTSHPSTLTLLLQPPAPLPIIILQTVTMGQPFPLTSTSYHHHQPRLGGVSTGGAELDRVCTESRQGMRWSVDSLLLSCDGWNVVHSSYLSLFLLLNFSFCFRIVFPFDVF